MGAAAITLPAGFWVDGVHHREAALRPLAGADEAYLQEDAGALPPARRTTALLARCLTRLGPWSPAPPAAVRALTVGDREAILLEIRRLTFGERLECVLRCAAPGCGEPLELDLVVGDLLAQRQEPASPWYDEELAVDGEVWRVRFRLPTGEDQELAADLAGDDSGGSAGAATPAGTAGGTAVADAAALLLERCVASAANAANADGETRALPAAVAAAVADRMAALDPQAETTLRLDCPACGQPMSALFDAGSWLFQELAGRAADLYREVHQLALHYHWREADILEMTGRKRRLYLGLLAETLGAERRET